METNLQLVAVCHVPAPVLHNRETMREKSIIKTENMLMVGKNDERRHSTGEIIH